MKPTALLLAAGLLLFSGPIAWSQGRDNDKEKNKDSEKKQYKDDREREKDKKEYKYKEKDDKNRHEGKGNGRATRTGGVLGDILGRVVLPPAGTVGPRRLEGVPRGHYPPPGECRVWYPNRPAGHQPPPTSCQNLVGTRLEPGAFILHGDQAYDTAYDWREEERRRPGSIGRDILDILFPRR